MDGSIGTSVVKVHGDSSQWRCLHGNLLVTMAVMLIQSKAKEEHENGQCLMSLIFRITDSEYPLVIIGFCYVLFS